MKRVGLFYLLLLLTPLISMAQSSTILQGKIVDENSNAVAGASVHLLNSKYGAVTNESGNFFIKNIFPGNYMLNVSRIGYAEINQEINIDSAENSLEIVLRSSYKQLSEVTVTTQKREELLQKLPLSITALNAKAVEDYRIWNMNDLTAIAPNLYTSDPGDKRNVTSIRGIVTTSYDPAIAVYIDGVNQFGLDTYITQLFDVERIEILRGPQGTLYGRNAMGGVINIITKRPENKTTGFAEASLGSYGHQRYTAGIRTALIKDKLFFGAAGLYEKTKGFYTNEFDNTDYDKKHSVSGNYYLKYSVNPKWDVTLNVKHISNRNSGPFPLVPDVLEAIKNPYKLSQNAKTKMTDNIFNGSLSVNYTGRTFNFNSQSSYQSNYRFYKTAIDADFSPLDAISIFNNYGHDWNNVNVITQEFKFSSPAITNHPFKWTAGTYLFHQKSPVKQATIFGEDAMLLGMQDKNFSLINTTTATGSGVAVYGQGTYSVNEKIDIMAGLRYDYEHKKQSVLGEYQKDPDPDPAFAFRSDTAADANFNALSPKLSVAYHYTDNNTAFITYSKGFRAGGLTPLSSDPSQPALYRYRPEFSNNIEAGVKNVFFNKKLVLNATLFYTKVSNVQVPTLILPDAVTIIKNTGKLESKGAELEINALLLKGLELNYNFGYTDAVYNSLKVSQNSTEVNLQGKRQIFTPDITSMLALQYGVGIGAKKTNKFFVRGEWKYLGKQYFDLANTIVQSPYSIFNGQLGLTIKNISIIFWGRNLNDKNYIQYGYDFGAVHLGNPKTLGTTISIKI